MTLNLQHQIAGSLVANARLLMTCTVMVALSLVLATGPGHLTVSMMNHGTKTLREGADVCLEDLEMEI